MRLENEKSARADFLPSLSGGANFNYTGHPLELSVAVPSLNEPLSFQGRDTKYGASLSLLQPVYSGSALKAGYNKAVKESELSRYEKNGLQTTLFTMPMCITGIRWLVTSG